MRTILSWVMNRSGEQPAQPLDRLQAVLKAAAETRYYRPWLESARMMDGGRVRRPSSVSEALASIPRVEAAWFADHPAEFRSQRRSNRLAPRLRHPFDPAPRTAVLDTWYSGGPEVRCFGPDDMDDVRMFAPESLAAPASFLLEWARMWGGGQSPLPSVRHSLIAFSDLRRGLLDAGERDLLWRAFQVPLFEQLRGYGGELLAAECEAHAGLHVHRDEMLIEVEPARGSTELVVSTLMDIRQPALRIATGWSPELEETVCGCGVATVRLAGLRALATRAAAARAAC